MNKVLEIKNLSKSFGNRKVIDNVTFDVYSGEVFGFLGPNGAGKTTTIKMILGLLKIDEGTILVNGFDVNRDFEKAMECIGGIVENPDMYGFLSGRKNLELCARMRNVDKSQIDKVVEMVGMTNRIDDKVRKYSLGMKQRLGLAQALLHKPDILILDEPTNGLDPSGIKELRDNLKKLAHEENIAVFVSSHLLSEMQLMCDRVAIINKGILQEVMPIKDLPSDKSQEADTAVRKVYRYKARPLDKAVSVLQEKMPQTLVSVTSDYLDLNLTDEEMFEVNSLMVSERILVYSQQILESNLEDLFMNITGGSRIE